MLDGVGVFNHEEDEVKPLDRFIWSFRSATRQNKPILEKGDNPNTDWTKLCRVNDDCFVLYTSDVSNIDGLNDLDEFTLTVDESIANDTFYTIFIKPVEESKIRYALGRTVEDIDEEKSVVIDLKNL